MIQLALIYTVATVVIVRMILRAPALQETPEPLPETVPAAPPAPAPSVALQELAAPAPPRRKPEPVAGLGGPGIRVALQECGFAVPHCAPFRVRATKPGVELEATRTFARGWHVVARGSGGQPGLDIRPTSLADLIAFLTSVYPSTDALRELA